MIHAIKHLSVKNNFLKHLILLSSLLPLVGRFWIWSVPFQSRNHTVKVLKMWLIEYMWEVNFTDIFHPKCNRQWGKRLADKALQIYKQIVKAKHCWHEILTIQKRRFHFVMLYIELSCSMTDYNKVFMLCLTNEMKCGFDISKCINIPGHGVFLSICGP